MRARASQPPELTCDRCGQPVEVPWCDVTMLGDPEPMVLAGLATCATPGCLDELGRAVVRWPPQPGELTVEDRDWVDRQMHIGGESP